MALIRPQSRALTQAQATALLVLVLALPVLSLWLWPEQPVLGTGFLGLPHLTSHRVAAALPRHRSSGRLRAQAIDAEVVGDDDEEFDEDEEEEEEFEEDEEEDTFELEPGAPYPPEALKEYGPMETPPASYWARRKIDRHKVNMLFFDMFKKPREFFPHDLKPGDTVRVYYLDPVANVDKDIANMEIERMEEKFFDGVLMDVKGSYHMRSLTLRGMVGRGTKVMGMEMNFPMHSPLVRKLTVLRRGYIGRAKKAYFIRGMVGKRNVIPIDKERTKVDDMYEALRLERRYDEIPTPEYPTRAVDRYPLPIWKQDMDDWDESQYDPDKVDQRSDYEKRVIDRYKKRIPGPKGKPGGYRVPKRF